MLHSQIESILGMTGKWDPSQTVFKIDPITYGYLSPIQKLEIEALGGWHLVSSPITNTEWWHWFMPVSSCPRYKGHLVEIPDRFDAFCKAAACSEACGAEDGFVDLSAGRLRLIEEGALVASIFPRLQHYIDRAESLTKEICQHQGTAILVDSEQGIVRLHTRLKSDLTELQSHVKAFKQLYPMITGVQGKVNTGFLPQAKTYSQDDLNEVSILEEARYYALVEAVRQEALDMLDFLLERKNGRKEDNVYHIDQNNISYTLLNHRIEATRGGLYMGNEGFTKGVQEIQSFFQTTLGGGRW